MQKIHILSQSSALAPYKVRTKEIAKKSFIKIRKALPLVPMDIVIFDSPINTMITGETLGSHLIFVRVNPRVKRFSETLASELENVIVHESLHAVRYTKIPWRGNTLFEAVINEGLALHFEIEITHTKPSPLVLSVSEKDLDTLKKKLHKELDNRKFDFTSWFFGDSKRKIPNAAGYALGFDIVKRHMEKSGKKASELVFTTSEEFDLFA